MSRSALLPARRLAIPSRLGNPRRFDAIWATPDVEVLDVRYLSEEIGRLSDHAPVVAELRLDDPMTPPG